MTAICALATIPRDAGVAALLPGDVQVAVFRYGEADDVYALSNMDPCSGAAVLSRGIVGDADGVPTVASPIYKQRFDLRTGQCLDQPDIRVPTFAAHLVDGVIHVDGP